MGCMTSLTLLVSSNYYTVKGALQSALFDGRSTRSNSYLFDCVRTHIGYAMSKNGTRPQAAQLSRQHTQFPGSAGSTRRDYHDRKTPSRPRESDTSNGSP
jgi:hypothetical protein